MLTARIIKEKAREYGADLCGIASIDRFLDTDEQRSPLSVLPNAKSVIGFGFRIPKGLYYCMDRETQYSNYVSLGVKYIDEDLSEIFLLKMAALIENKGYDACVQRNISNLKIKGDKTQNPEVKDTYELVHARAVAEGKPVPDVIMDFPYAAKMCGLGSVSLKGNVITKEYGPFVRFVFIVTDAPLEPDSIFEENLCDSCGECIKACPGNAVSEEGLDSWQCSVYYRGAHRSNPYMTEDFLKGNPHREAILNGEYRFDSVSARGIYPHEDFMPMRQTGYAPCLCGKACDTACFNHLKRKGVIK
ncbi:MAG: epoxyqueuosine reductase [Clostridiales bacterium]|nr:epoxyqueuosine reductase [Clostridiales bacterium]